MLFIVYVRCNKVDNMISMGVFILDIFEKGHCRYGRYSFYRFQKRRTPKQILFRITEEGYKNERKNGKPN